mgnify:CR=1 FL=1
MITTNISDKRCDIETVYDEQSHNYYAVCSLVDKLVLGFSPERAEAIEYCLELVEHKSRASSTR